MPVYFSFFRNITYSCCSGEGESWKDELLGLARSKQERTESELLCLRQVLTTILCFQ